MKYLYKFVVVKYVERFGKCDLMMFEIDFLLHPAVFVAYHFPWTGKISSKLRMRLFSCLYGSKDKSTILHLDIDPVEAVRRIHARGEEVQAHENQRDLTTLRAEFARVIAAGRSDGFYIHTEGNLGQAESDRSLLQRPRGCFARGSCMIDREVCLEGNLEMVHKRHVAGDHGVTIEDIRDFWEHFEYDDVRVVESVSGTSEFFAALSAIRARRLEYLVRLANFGGYQGKRVLEVGCRIGLDLANFARHGAQVTGIDLSRPALAMARTHFSLMGLMGEFMEMNGEAMEFADHTFDLVYAHGVVQYTARPERMIQEMHRVLKPGGAAFLMAYNKYSWLVALSKVSGKNLTHEEAPGFELYTRSQFRELLAPFSSIEIIPERFPVRTGLHEGALSKIYYGGIVSLFNMLPKAWTGPLGAHLVARVTK